LKFYNASATIKRPLITTENTIGEPTFTTPTTIGTNIPCFFEKRSRSIIYDLETKVPHDSGLESTDSYSMYISANVVIANSDIVTINSVDYVVISIIIVSKLGSKISHQEISLERI